MQKTKIIISPLTGPEGVNIENLTQPDGQHWYLVVPFSIVNDGGDASAAGTIGLQMTLLRKDPVAGMVLDDQMSQMFDLPAAAVPAEGNAVIYSRRATDEDACYLDIKRPMADPRTPEDYELTITPDFGPALTIAFTRTNSAATQQAILATPTAAVVIPAPPEAELRPASVRAKLTWVKP